MSKKTWIIFTVICVAVLGGLIFVSQKDKINVDKIDQNKIQSASASNGNIADHVLDKKDGKVLLVEYGDFECPYCGQAFPQVKSVTSEYASKITFVFRNYPLATMHPNARAAAAAAEAAGLQGKYWEMHDKLYETQNDWSSASIDKRTGFFVNYAKQLGIANIDKFKSDMGANNVNKKITFDMALGNKAKVSGTPTFVLNGTTVSDKVASSIINGNGSELKKAIDEALK
ncbi:MAG: DsbA family protein [Candidatus Nomurabacteria bacterium]|nr:MAG: DsbA family protein [Candidatus Nomurabacteria bacterium]